MIGFDDWSDAVHEHARYYLKAFSDDEIERYFNSKEVRDFLNERYKNDVADFKDGKITEKILREGCVNSAGYCLMMMFE